MFIFSSLSKSRIPEYSSMAPNTNTIQAGREDIGIAINIDVIELTDDPTFYCGEPVSLQVREMV